jgi:hypothetical protein
MENTAQKIQELQNLCALQAQQIAELTAKVNWYEEQFRLSQKRRFGRLSENLGAGANRRRDHLPAPQAKRQARRAAKRAAGR